MYIFRSSSKFIRILPMSRKLSLAIKRESNIFKFQSLVDMQIQSCSINSNKPLFGTKVGPVFEWKTYKDFDLLVQRFRNVLAYHNIGHNDKVIMNLSICLITYLFILNDPCVLRSL